MAKQISKQGTFAPQSIGSGKNQKEEIYFSIGGKLINKEEIVQEVLAASARVKAGEFISQEDLEKEAENW